ncbi:MAG: ComEC family competence protein [Spirulina sp. SIO3F2]|nr:ComEC family competence protein [Spirulina sp. SIO3F2]
MSRYSWAVLLIAYVTGLITTGLPYSGWVWTGVIALSSLVLGLVMPYRWRPGPKRHIWWLAGVVGILAIAHFQLRQPQPSQWDMSRWVNQTPDSVTVAGQILERPRQNRQGRIRFPLQVERLNQNNTVSGKLYVTVPLLHGTGLVPGQTVTLTGRLYEPQPAQTPGSFDFKQYLARQGIFAGLSGRLAAEPEPAQQRFGSVRQRIVRSLVRGLGSPNGFLVSSMVLGRRAVDLPSDVQQQFTQAGLAHTLAASGFHVSLLVGTVIMLVKPLPPRAKLWVGLVTLAVYLSLTGFHASVVRAALMGVAGLVALVVRRGVRPMGLLLVTATGLLLINPLWIWDVGFQLSFMATAGLVVTVPWLQAQLQAAAPWLPAAIATPFLIPIAVLAWTLPITLSHFHVMPLYGITVNAGTSPLVMVVTLGGMLSAAIAAIIPPLGAWVAQFLSLPVQLLRDTVAWSNMLPGAQWHGGEISLWQLVWIYGGIALLLYVKRLRSGFRWGVVLSLGLVLLGPYYYSQWTKVQITVLAAPDYPVVVIQDRGKTGLIGLGDRATYDYQLQPFLAQAGVNRFRAVVELARDPMAVREAFRDRYPVRKIWQFVPPPAEAGQKVQLLSDQQEFQIGSTVVRRIAQNPPLLEVQLPEQTWLIAPEPLVAVPQLERQPDVIVARDRPLIASALAQSKSAIAITVKAVKEGLADPNDPVEHYAIETDGTVWWTPERGIQTGREVRESVLD